MAPDPIKGNGGVSQSRRLLPARSHLRAAGRAGDQARSCRPAPAHLPEMNRATLRVSLLLLLLPALGRAGSDIESDQEHGGEEPPHSPGKGERGSLGARGSTRRGALLRFLRGPRARGISELSLGSPVPKHPDACSTPVLTLGSLIHGVP